MSLLHQPRTSFHRPPAGTDQLIDGLKILLHEPCMRMLVPQ